MNYAFVKLMCLYRFSNMGCACMGLLILFLKNSQEGENLCGDN